MTYTEDDIREALCPIASLISKSEKAREKVAPGTWQHTMLSDNLEALYLASTLMSKGLSGTTEGPASDTADLQKALSALASMIGRTVKSQANFSPGQSQHTLQRNRLKALRVAEALVKAEAERLETEVLATPATDPLPRARK
jgi:hypothetical protein